MQSIRKLLGKKKVAPAPLPKPTAEEVEKSVAAATERSNVHIGKLLGAKTEEEAAAVTSGGRRRKTRRGKKARRSTRKSRR